MGEGQARLTRGSAPMHDLLEMADERQHREHRLDEHTVLPLATRTQLEDAGIALCGMEGGYLRKAGQSAVDRVL